MADDQTTPQNTTEETTYELSEETQSTGTFNQEEFEAVKNLVSRKTSQADELKEKIRELAESLKNMLVNDSTLADAEETLKETRKAVTKRKNEIANSEEAQSIKAKLRELKEEMADIEDSLSTQLLNLYQITGVKEFETNTGEVREFVIKAKVKAKKIKA